MTIHLGAMLGWAMLPAVALGAVGAVPTWRFAGRAGLEAQTTAAGVVLAIMLVNAAAVRHCGKRGPRGVAFAFLILSVPRLALCPCLTAAAWKLLAPPPHILFAWTGLFYIAMLFSETAYVARAIRRKALGHPHESALPEPVCRQGPLGEDCAC
jgi:hypothetical protein